MGMTQELRNTDPQLPVQTYWIRICIVTSSQMFTGTLNFKSTSLNHYTLKKMLLKYPLLVFIMVATELVFYKLKSTYFLTQRLNQYVSPLQFLSSSVYLKLCTAIRKCQLRKSEDLIYLWKQLKELSDHWGFYKDSKTSSRELRR